MGRLSKFHRAVISRTAMLVLAALLIYGGVRCLALGQRIEQAARQSAPNGEPRANSGFIPVYAGFGLLLGGGVFALMAVVPADTFARVMGPPNLRHPRF